jgi:hypothetical protein
MLARLFYNQLPFWARPEHPVMHYILGYEAARPRQQWLRGFLVLLCLGIVVALSFAYTSTNQDSQSYRDFMYYPLIGISLLMQLLALAITANTIALERQKGTWETLQITASGAGTSLRARWISVFYRLRWFLIPVILSRLVFVGFLVYDMTDFEGRAIDVLIIGISPEISVELAVLMLSALMTAAIIQPLVALAFDSAVGIFVSVISQHRGLAILTTILLMVGRVAISGLALFLGWQILDSNGTTAEILNLGQLEASARLIFLATQGDLSLRLLDLNILGSIWADVPDGFYVTASILAWVVLQAFVANGLVHLAAWRAGRPSRS